MAKKASSDKTYILELKNGDTRKITIPASWKMTYGSVVPYTTRNERPGTHADYALRLYEGSKENLRAVMTDVVAIRDASIQLMEKRTTVQRKQAQKSTAQGGRDVVVEARITEWVDPDNEDQGVTPKEFLKIGGTVERLEDDF